MNPMLTLVTPRRDKFCEMSKAEVPAYLKKNGLTSSRAGVKDTLVVYSREIQASIDRARKNKSCMVKRRLNDRPAFIADVRRALRACGLAACFASHKMFARYYIVFPIFCREWDQMAEEIEHCRLIVPAGMYGQQICWAVESTDRG